MVAEKKRDNGFCMNEKIEVLRLTDGLLREAREKARIQVTQTKLSILWSFY